MSASVEVTGLSAVQQALQRLAQQMPNWAGDVLEARTTIEVRSRETVSGNRKPLIIARTDVLEMRVGWPYRHEGGEGTYVSRIVGEVAQLLPDSLGRDIGQALERAAKS